MEEKIVESEEKTVAQIRAEELENALAPSSEYDYLMNEAPQEVADNGNGVIVDKNSEALILNGVDVLPELENPTINSYLTFREKMIIVRDLIARSEFSNVFHPYTMKEQAKAQIVELFKVEIDSKFVEWAVEYIKELAKFVNVEFKFTDEKDNSIIIRLVHSTPNIYDFTLTQRRNLLKMTIPDTDVVRFEKALKFLNSIVLSHNLKLEREAAAKAEAEADRIKKEAEERVEIVIPERGTGSFSTYTFNKNDTELGEPKRLPSYEEEMANRNNEIDFFIQYISENVNQTLAKDLRSIKDARYALERLKKYARPQSQTRKGFKD